MTPARIIYGLLDPSTDEIRYVGRSSSGLKRAKHHLQRSVLSKDFTHKGHWLRKLGTAPGVLVLEDCSREDLAEREVWWIAFGRSEGWPLTNETDGGEGGHTGRRFTPEHCARISMANKGRQLTDEQRAKLSAAMRGKKNPSASQLHRRPLIELTTGRVFSWKGEAAKELGLGTASITRVVSGKIPSVKGYVFRHYSSDQPQNVAPFNA
jgi:hypothetical protein